MYSMRSQYAAEGVNLRTEIVSLADVLAPAAQNLACPLNRKSVYYHDPCYHARYNNVIEAPRRALSQLAEVRELNWNKADTEYGVWALLRPCGRFDERYFRPASPTPGIAACSWTRIRSSVLAPGRVS